MNLPFFKNKSVFITGHTGFKGSWLCRVLQRAGARITGYALAPEGIELYSTTETEGVTTHIKDIRDFDSLRDAFFLADPEIVFHLAAQPLVLDAYERPAYTFETNVLGTVNLLECIRQSDNVKSVVIVTTDKVYKNNEWVYGYRENDELGGREPYSASKACAELVAAAYAESYLRQKGIALSTARAGNVIGGGDTAKNRILPDCVRAAKKGETIIVRNPYAIRPYQHVLEPIFAYLLIALKQYENSTVAGQYNIGPGETDCINTATIADIFCQQWGDNQTWETLTKTNAPHESLILKLDCTKMRTFFGWKPVWDAQTAVAKTVEWEKSTNKTDITNKQIDLYIKEFIT
jgi:CDP-glucose 4,6-dehydratase